MRIVISKHSSFDVATQPFLTVHQFASRFSTQTRTTFHEPWITRIRESPARVATAAWKYGGAAVVRRTRRFHAGMGRVSASALLKISNRLKRMAHRGEMTEIESRTRAISRCYSHPSHPFEAVCHLASFFLSWHLKLAYVPGLRGFLFIKNA